MNKKILIAISVAAIVLVVLFIAAINGLSVPPKKSPQPVAPASAAAPKAADFQEVLANEKKKLHPDVLRAIVQLEEKMAMTTDEAEKRQHMEEIGKKWIDIKKPVIGAYYFSELGFLENSEKKLTFASHLLNEGFKTVENAELRQWMAETAIKNLNKVLEMDPKNVDAKLELANIYIEGIGQPMQGVAQLQDIVRNDSSNFKANLILGQMAIESNQLDKAIERGQLVLKYHPKSWEARLFMAEANYRLGKKAEAIELLEEAKKYNPNDAFIQDVDRYIEKIK